jgi:peptidoglycan hydrolase CwlO-like protein
MRAINDDKARQLHDFDNAINVRMADNGRLRDKIKDIERCIVKECDDGRGLRIELGRTNDDIGRATSDIAVTDNLIGQRLADIDDLNKRINRRIVDIEDRRKDIRIAEGEIARLNDNIAKAKFDQDKLR